MSTTVATGRRRRRRGNTAPLPAGTRAGSFTIERLRSAGGFGAVYEARGDDGRRAAVKVMHADLTATDQAVARFAREVDAVRRIRHPNVVDVLDVGRLEDGRPYLAMELLDGDDLATVVSRRGRLAPADALAVLAPLCDALAAVHAHGVVHRDVKPGNVILVEGAPPRPVLVDFGIAKLIDEDAGLTASRQAVGTPAYMAPEQGGGQAVDRRADVYALGALAFFLLTGSPPFAHESRTVLMHLHRHARRTRPSTRAPVPPAIDEVIVRAMQADPAARYPDVIALGQALEAACAETPSPMVRGRSIACHVRVAAAPRDAGDLDADAIADAIAEVHADTAAWLGGAGFVLALDSSRTQVWVRPVDGDPAIVLAASQAAVRELERRRGRPVIVRGALRVGDAAWREGRPVGGELLDWWDDEPGDDSGRITVAEYP